MLPKFKKPEKWHFKVFALNDAITGYMFDFYSDEGASEVRDEDVKATTQPILKLFCENQTYRNRNHVLITDNWYSGMENLWQVLDTGNHYSTVRIYNQGMGGTDWFDQRLAYYSITDPM